MKGSAGISRNIPLAYAGELLSEMRFFIPVWVAFHLQFITFGEMGVIAAIRFATTLILELPTGAFADLLGRRRSVIIGLALDAIGLFFLFTAHAPYMFYIAAIIRATGESFQSGAQTALLFDTMKELGRENEFAKIRSNGVMWSQYGLIISSIVGGLMSTVSLRMPFAMSIVTSILAGICAYAMIEPHIDSEKFSLASYIRQTKQGFKEVFASTYTTLLGIFYAIFGGITWAWQVHFNIAFLASFGYPESIQGFVYGGFRLFNAIVVALFIRHLKVTRKLSFIILPLVLAAIAGSAQFASGLVGLLIFSPLYLPSTLRFIMLDTQVNAEFSSKNRATALSTLNMMVGFIYIGFILAFGTAIGIAEIKDVYTISGVLALLILFPLGVVLMNQRNTTVDSTGRIHATK